MTLIFEDKKTGAELRFVSQSERLDRAFYGKDRKDKLLTIAWNRGPEQNVNIDGADYLFPSNAILPLMVSQSFQFEDSESIVAWQFNRDFYCIVNHDKEVGCVGFLFYGMPKSMFIQLSEGDIRKIDLLSQVFSDEFDNADDIQGEMLRMLLVRLIITITRLAKQQYINNVPDDGTKFNLVRQFNLMVENNYRNQHEVQFYAAALAKSPKTLANAFALYGTQSPLQIIQERILTEAKRLFYYTDKSSKEVAAELGFEDAGHFSRFFKNGTGQNPSDFKKSLLSTT